MNAHDHQASWRHLPVGDLKNVTGTGRCLIIAPHPDDESLGCGGLIAASVAAGRPPLVAILTDGAGSHPGSHAFPPERLRAVRSQEARRAANLLGLQPNQLILLDQPDTRAPREGPGFDAMVDRLLALRPPDCTAILAPWRHDPHCDHEAASEIASAVARLAGVPHIAYPVWGWTLPPLTPVPGRPGPGVRVDIKAFLPAKRAAIQAHRSQHGNLISDDPNGFRLPPELLSVFDSRFETFLFT